MKTLSLILFLWGIQAWANCGSVECYDPCTKANYSLEGDKCSVTWNEEDKCFEAYAECKDSKKCWGALCYDHCLERSVYFKRANSCKEFFDPRYFCWSVQGVCK